MTSPCCCHHSLGWGRDTEQGSQARLPGPCQEPDARMLGREPLAHPIKAVVSPLSLSKSPAGLVGLGLGAREFALLTSSQSCGGCWSGPEHH